MTRNGLVQVLRHREFRVIWLAELLSVAGDQLARVALAVLVFDRTGSAALAAVTYALTFLPALLGGLLLSGLADRYRRREVMIVCDLLRAALVAVMAVPQLPLVALQTLVVVVVLLGAPHAAAQGALLPTLLAGDLYERGLAVRQITGQAAQMVGFAAGGLLVAAITPGPALLVNAVTFGFAAVLLRLGVAARPRPAADAGPSVARPGGWRGMVAGVAAIAVDRRRRVLVLLAWLVGCYVVPEALAAPYAAQLGAGPAAVGLLMAADPLGSVLGAWLFARFVPVERRAALIGVLAVAAGLPLVGTLARPGVLITVLLWGLSGMASTAYLLQVQASFVLATPDAGRGQAIGIAASGILAAQGVAVLAGGVLAELADPATAIAAAGSVGVLLAAVGALAWRQASRPGRVTNVPSELGQN